MRILTQFYPALSIIVLGSISFVISSCKCDDARQGAEYADLIVTAYDEKFHDDVSSDPYYELIFTVANSLLNVECPEEVDDAAPHENGIPIMYSETSDFSNATKVQDAKATITKSTDGGNTYVMSTEITFSVDGYYAINYTLDVENDVQERLENNNTGKENIGNTNGRKRPFTYSKIIHVKNTGRNTPDIDANGNKQFIKQMDIKITYDE